MDKNTNAEKVIYEKDMYLTENAEQDITRTYEQERLYLQRIKTGDVEAILAKREGRQVEIHMGRLAETPLKNFEYMVCGAITLATYAAIDGGLDPASAYAMSDLYLRRLELCRESAEMQQLYDEVELVFAQQVHQVRQNRSAASYVEMCKLFIDQHLTKSFTLDDIAAALNVNKSYLSRRFAQEAGMRIMEYARQKRIEGAAYMLKYSDKTISAIAAYFSFPSQSHFGNLFKQVMGSTPLKYRAANQIIEVPSGE
ncbi:MAG: AraC family transcriptional regulator [Oscillospiraceae bacterium]|nr:AraC family transcriptional regulator [Oscillospiraceae bacterium]